MLMGEAQGVSPGDPVGSCNPVDGTMPENLACAHCEASGTCKNGPDSTTCAVCVSKHKLTSAAPESLHGLPCWICKGRGHHEPLAVQIQNQIVPGLAIVIAFAALAFVARVTSKDRAHDSEIITFSATLIGSVTGFYFGGKQKAQ